MVLRLSGFASIVCTAAAFAWRKVLDEEQARLTGELGRKCLLARSGYWNQTSSSDFILLIHGSAVDALFPRALNELARTVVEVPAFGDAKWSATAATVFGYACLLEIEERKRYRYWIVLDGRAGLQWDAEENARWRQWLLKWEPAVGLPWMLPHYGEWSSHLAGPSATFIAEDAMTWAVWEDSLVAYHSDAVNALFPEGVEMRKQDPCSWLQRWGVMAVAGAMWPANVLVSASLRPYSTARRAPQSECAPPGMALTYGYMAGVAFSLMGRAKSTLHWDVSPVEDSYSLRLLHRCTAHWLMAFGVRRSIWPARGRSEGYSASAFGCSEDVHMISSELGPAMAEANSRYWNEWYLSVSLVDANERKVARQPAFYPFWTTWQRSSADAQDVRQRFEQCMRPVTREGTGAPHRYVGEGYLPERQLKIQTLPIKHGHFLHALVHSGPLGSKNPWLEVLKTRTNCYILLVTWKAPLDEQRHGDLLSHPRFEYLYLPNSSVEEDKYIRYIAAVEWQLALGYRFEYTIVCDGDVQLQFSTFSLTSVELSALKQEHGDALSYFHHVLSRDRPARGIVAKGGTKAMHPYTYPFSRHRGPLSGHKTSVRDWDDIVGAIHATALPFIVFDVGYDSLNWHLTDLGTIAYATALFAGRVLQFNDLEPCPKAENTGDYLEFLDWYGSPLSRSDSIGGRNHDTFVRMSLVVAARVAAMLPPGLAQRVPYENFEVNMAAPEPWLGALEDYASMWRDDEQPGCPEQGWQPSRRTQRQGNELQVHLFQEFLISFVARATEFANYSITHSAVQIPGTIRNAPWSGPFSSTALLKAFRLEAALHFRVYELLAEDADRAKGFLDYMASVFAEVPEHILPLLEGHWRPRINTITEAAASFSMVTLPELKDDWLLLHYDLSSRDGGFLPAQAVPFHDPRQRLRWRRTIGYVHKVVEREGVEAARSCPRADGLTTPGGLSALVFVRYPESVVLPEPTLHVDWAVTSVFSGFLASWACFQELLQGAKYTHWIEADLLGPLPDNADADTLVRRWIRGETLPAATAVVHARDSQPWKTWIQRL
eukprot:TRINITY_DN77055_c0_g1_i1.p1 TRINITY_DN77055_c0_g1~~TRINITY_DN77055_c0_g1_i1.p1  ORF type:complete len:1055 (-),score=162.38 TRINITY_DN77055_c0_g1_i1:150-3314(-)